MNHSQQPARRNTPGDSRDVGTKVGIKCPISTESIKFDELTANLGVSLEDAGCPVSTAVLGRLRFETLLTELSAKFVNVPANRVDSQIESGLATARGVTGPGSGRPGRSIGRRQTIRGHTFVPIAGRTSISESNVAFAIPDLRNDASAGEGDTIAG